MNKKTLRFNNIKLNKKKIHKSKKPIDLFSVDLDQIVVSDKFKHNDEGFSGILLVTRKEKMLNHYVTFCHKLMDT